MSRMLRIADSDYLESSIAVSAAPISLACWFRAKNITANHTLIGCFDGDGSNIDAFYLSASGASANDPVQFVTAQNNAFSVGASPTPGFNANQWHHAGGVSSGVASRYGYLDGRVGTEQTTSRTPTGILVSRAGVFQQLSTLTYSDVDVCEMGVWNVALAHDEMARLAAGAPCADVRPESLIGYWLPIREPDLGSAAAKNYARSGFGPMRPMSPSSQRRALSLPFVVSQRRRIVRKPPYGGAAKPWLYRPHTQTLGAGFGRGAL